MWFLFLAIISGLGFLASLACHILGWLRINPPGGKKVFALHVIIFPLWIAMLILAGRNKAPNSGRRATVGPLLETLPPWLTQGVAVLFIYAIIHFILFAIQTGGKRSGMPLYLEVRGVSGHWMMFYAVATAGFFALYRTTHP
jgi:hypothetical protein